MGECGHVAAAAIVVLYRASGETLICGRGVYTVQPAFGFVKVVEV